MCQQDLRDGVPNCHSAPAKAVGTLPPFRRPCLALFSYPLYKSSRAAKISGDRNRLPRGTERDANSGGSSFVVTGGHRAKPTHLAQWVIGHSSFVIRE